MYPGIRSTILVLLSTACLLGIFVEASAQDYGSRLGTPEGDGETTYAPRGPGGLLGALDPAMRKWYVSQELYAEYAWKQWEYSNYARDQYNATSTSRWRGTIITTFTATWLTTGG